MTDTCTRCGRPTRPHDFDLNVERAGGYCAAADPVATTSDMRSCYEHALAAVAAERDKLRALLAEATDLLAGVAHAPVGDGYTVEFDEAASAADTWLEAHPDLCAAAEHDAEEDAPVDVFGGALDLLVGAAHHLDAATPAEDKPLLSRWVTCIANFQHERRLGDTKDCRVAVVQLDRERGYGWIVWGNDGVPLAESHDSNPLRTFEDAATAADRVARRFYRLVDDPPAQTDDATAGSEAHKATT